jgi:hypothetical protein
MSSGITMRNKRGRTVTNDRRNKGNNPFKYYSFSEVMKKSGRGDSIKCPSNVK